MSKISEMLYVTRPLVVNPEIATAIGLNESIIIQQIHYWMQRSSNERDGMFWVFKTYEEWNEEFPFWSVSTIRRAISRLESMGEIISTTEYNRMAIDNTNWYTIPDSPMNRPPGQNEQTTWSKRTDQVVKMNRPPGQNEQANNQRLQSETTPETTPETTDRSSYRLVCEDTPIQPTSPGQSVGQSEPNTIAILLDSVVCDRDERMIGESQARKYKDLDPEWAFRCVYDWLGLSGKG